MRKRERQGVTQRPSSESGFTLLEVMMALVAGLAAITSIYQLSSNSSRHFHEQQRIAQTQMGVRMAMEQLRRDVARAGYGGTPDSALEQTCVAPVVPIHAVEFHAGVDTPNLQNADENGVNADRLRLVGNYATSDRFLSAGLDSTGNTIFLQQAWQSFRRTFGVAFQADFVFDPAAFDRVFLPGRLLHIESVSGQHFFVNIVSADSGTASIRFSPTLPVGTPCVPSLLRGATVTPLSRIEWTVFDVLNGSDLAEGAGGEFMGLTSPQWVRQEIGFEAPGDPGSSPVFNQFQRVVLENVADVTFSFVVDQGSAANNLPVIQRIDDGATAEALLANEPGRVRSIIASVSSHVPEQNKRFPWVPRDPGAPLTRFRVNPQYPGAARVRTGVSELVMPNLAARNFRYF